MNTKMMIAVGSGIAILSFGAGRYSVPTKVKTETKVVQNKVKDENKKIAKKKHKTTTIIKKPDGTKTTTITEDDASDTEDRTKVTDNKNSDTSKEVVKSGGSLNISALAARDPQTGQLTYGAQVIKDIIGPINVGLFGLANGTVGGSIGIRF